MKIDRNRERKKDQDGREKKELKRKKERKKDWEKKGKIIKEIQI